LLEIVSGGGLAASGCESEEAPVASPRRFFFFPTCAVPALSAKLSTV